MLDAMKFWINEADIDGFRCDAVSFMPLDFWKSIPWGPWGEAVKLFSMT